MFRKDDLNVHLRGARDDGVEVGGFSEPEENTIPVGPIVRITDLSVIVLNVEAVQLQDKNAVRGQPLVLTATMVTLQSEQLLIPAAARFYIIDCYQRLRAHGWVQCI